MANVYLFHAPRTMVPVGLWERFIVIHPGTVADVALFIKSKREDPQWRAAKMAYNISLIGKDAPGNDPVMVCAQIVEMAVKSGGMPAAGKQVMELADSVEGDVL